MIKRFFKKRSSKEIAELRSMNQALRTALREREENLRQLTEENADLKFANETNKFCAEQSSFLLKMANEELKELRKWKQDALGEWREIMDEPKIKIKVSDGVSDRFFVPVESRGL